MVKLITLGLNIVIMQMVQDYMIQSKDTTKYIGIAINKTTATESTNKTDYTWSKFRGDNGEQGDKGQSLVSSVHNGIYLLVKLHKLEVVGLKIYQSVTQGKYLWLRYKLTWENHKLLIQHPTLEQVAEQVKDVTSKQSQIRTVPDGFKMTVSDTYTTKVGLDEVKQSIQNKDGYTIILSKECIVTTCE